MKEEHIKDSDDIHVYELGYHLLPTIEEGNLESLTSKIKEIILSLGGVIIAEGNPALRQLAYNISKKIDVKNTSFSKAYFGWLKFELDRAEVSTLKTKLDLNSNLLRFMIINTVKENTIYTPKIPMFRKDKEKEDKEEKNVDEPKQDEGGEVSEALIDKSIDELLIS